MSEPIPESIPTSHDPRSKRPVKRRALSPTSAHAAQVDALFAHPDREIRMPPSSSSALAKTLPPPPEIVANVQGSSAGAGSGEFHVYKASRRREYERLRLMDEEVRRETETAEFEKTRDENTRRDEERTKKNKARREKQKERKAKKAKKGEKGKGGGAGGEGSDMEVDGTDEVGKNGKIEAKNGVGSSDGKGQETEAEAGANPDEIGVIFHDDD